MQIRPKLKQVLGRQLHNGLPRVAIDDIDNHLPGLAIEGEGQATVSPKHIHLIDPVDSLEHTSLFKRLCLRQTCITRRGQEAAI